LNTTWAENKLLLQTAAANAVKMLLPAEQRNLQQ
jgi:hypothetical protein